MNNQNLLCKNNTYHPIKAIMTNPYIWMALIFALLMFLEPAHAQEWAQTTKGIADDIVKGLRMLCYPVALGAGIWIVIQIWTGNKRVQDMIGWMIAAAILIALPELVNLIPQG